MRSEEEMEEILDISVLLMKKLFSKEVAKIYAQFLWDFYNELQRVGFSKDESFKLLQNPLISTLKEKQK
jgi:hypothetical protein